MKMKDEHVEVAPEMAPIESNPFCLSDEQQAQLEKLTLRIDSPEFPAMVNVEAVWNRILDFYLVLYSSG